MPEHLDKFEPMFECIEQSHGERLSIICRGVVWQRQVQGLPLDDWNTIEYEARMILSPDAGIESEAQADLAFRSQISIHD